MGSPPTLLILDRVEESCWVARLDSFAYFTWYADLFKDTNFLPPSFFFIFIKTELRYYTSFDPSALNLILADT